MLPLAFKTDSEYSSEYLSSPHLVRFVVPRSTTVTEKFKPRCVGPKNVCSHHASYNQGAVVKFTNIGFSVCSMTESDPTHEFFTRE